MTAADVVLRGTDISINFGGLQALSGVSFELHRGELLGIVGPNGSGKTTLLNCISGVYQPTGGSIAIQGRAIGGMAPHAVAGLGVGRTFQHAEIPKDLTVLELALLGRHRLMNRYGLLDYGCAIPGFARYEQLHRAAALELLESAGLGPYAQRRLRDLPYGLVKRADVCRALAGEPRVLLLDEPAAGCNEEERETLAGVIASLRTEALSVLLVEHDMTFVGRLAEAVLVMVDGRKLAHGPTAATLGHDEVLQKFLGVGRTVATG